MALDNYNESIFKTLVVINESHLPLNQPEAIEVSKQINA